MFGFGLVEKVYNGTTDVFEGSAGFLTDVIRASHSASRGEISEGADILLGSVEEDLMGNVMGGLFGPEGIGGGVVGALPEGLRVVGRPVVNSVFGAWDWTIQEVVDRPLGTMWTMLNPKSLANNPLGLIDPTQYARAWQINDKRTFGQAVASAVFLVDPFDENEYNSVKDDPLFNLLSGTADFGQEFIDPVTYFGGGSIKLARGAAVFGKAGTRTGVGRTFANPSRFGGHLLPRTGELAPQYVMGGRQLGYRPSTIMGRRPEGRFSFLTKTDEQYNLRKEYISSWTQARARAVLDSPEWNRIEDAIGARPKLDGNDRFALFRRGLGRRGTKLPSETLRLIANGPTREARARTFRLLSGDNTVWDEIHRDASHYSTILRTPEGEQAARNIHIKTDAAAKGHPDFGQWSPTQKFQMDTLQELSDRTDWALVAAFEDSLILSQQKRMSFGPQENKYLIDDRVHETLTELPIDVQLAALDDLLGFTDDIHKYRNATGDSINNQQRYMGVTIKDMPKGKRFQELLARHRDELATNDFAVSEYINPNVIGGRRSRIRLLTAKISRTHIDHQSSTAFNDFETMLTNASNLKIGDERAITAAEVGSILGKYQGYLTDGNFHDAATLFERTNLRLMKWIDEQVFEHHLIDAEGGHIDATMRTMTEEYSKKKSAWKDPEKNRILSVTDLNPIKRKGSTNQKASLRAEKDIDGHTTFIQYGSSPSQLRNADIIPRYDVVQAHIDKALKREAQKRGQKIDDVARDLGARLQTILDNPNQIWRAAVLLTPKWPMRVGMDEQLRLMVNLGALNVVANFNVPFKRMRQNQAFTALRHGTGDVADPEILGSEMHQIVLRRHGVDTKTELPVGPLYDPVVEELVRGQSDRIRYVEEVDPKTVPDDVEPFEIPDRGEPDPEPQNLSVEESLRKERELEEAKARGRARREQKRREGDYVAQAMAETQRELREFGEYALPGQDIVPERMKGETANSYRGRLERELNDRYQRAAAQKKKAARDEDIRIAAEAEPLAKPRPLSAEERHLIEKGEMERPADAAPLTAQEIIEMRREGILEALPEGAPVFEVPENVGRQQKRMAEARPDINFTGLNMRNRGDLPTDIPYAPNEKGHWVAPGSFPGEVMMDLQRSPTFRLPTRFRPGQVHPDRAAQHNALRQRIERLENQRGDQPGNVVGGKGRLRALPNELPDEWAGLQLEGLSREQLNRQRKRPDGVTVLPDGTELPIGPLEFEELYEHLTGQKLPTVAEAEAAQAAATAKLDPVNDAKVAKELTDLRQQLLNLGITPEESQQLYRHWVEGRTPDGVSPEYLEFIQQDQRQVDVYAKMVGPTLEPSAEKVRAALTDGDLNGMTLVVEDMGRPHHGTVLNELQIQLDPRPVVKLAVSGSKTINNAEYIWAAMDDMWIQNAQTRRVELVIMPDVHDSGVVDHGKGFNHHVFEWAKDRGVPVRIRDIRSQAQFTPGMALEWYQAKGVIFPAPKLSGKPKPGQPPRPMSIADIEQHVLQVAPELVAEYDKYKKWMWRDGARKRDNIVVGETDSEILFRHDRGIDPETGKYYYDPNYSFGLQAFNEARRLDPNRPMTNIISVADELGKEPTAGVSRKPSRIKSMDEIRRVRRDKDAQQAEEARQTEAYYESLLESFNQPGVSDRLADELIEELHQDLVAEFGADYDPVLLQERMREANPVVDIPEAPKPKVTKEQAAVERDQAAMDAVMGRNLSEADREGIARAEIEAEAEPDFPEGPEEVVPKKTEAEVKAEEEGFAEAETEAYGELDEPEESVDVSQYEVSLAEHMERQAERDWQEYAADSELDTDPIDQAVLDAAADEPEVFSEVQYDYEKQFDLLGKEGLTEAVDNVVRERILVGRNLRRLRRNAGIKSLLGMGIVFGNPAMGAAWGFMSYLSKRRKINAAAQRKAAMAYGTAMRQQGRQLLDEMVSLEDQKVARDLMSDAEYIQKLIDDEVENASKVKNAFDYADELMGEAGFPSLQIGNMAFRSAFGDDNRYAEQIHRQVSANGGMSAIYSGVHKHQSRELERYGKQGWERSSYTDLKVPRNPDKLDSREFAENYDRLINLYTSNAGGSKPFYQIVWGNKPVKERVDDLYELLTKDRDLFALLVDDRGKHFGVWDDIGVEERKAIAENIVKEYENVLPTQYFPELRQRARSGAFTWADVERRLDALIDEGKLLKGVELRHFQNARMEAVAELQGEFDGFGKAIAPEQSAVREGRFANTSQKVQQVTEDLFQKYGALPSDELARHPFFKAVYEREMRRTIEPMLDADGYVNLSQKQIDRIENSARNVALNETKRVLYELGESSRIAELLGNASPFFNAWQEVTSRWAGFAVDNPMFVGNVARLYRKPWEAEALGLSQFEDENGNTYVALRLFGDAFDEDGVQRSIFDVMPQSVKDVVIPPILSDAGQTMRFSKDGLNTMLQGTPGAGPLVVIPAREVVLSNPELEPTLGFLFPFGHPQSSNFVERNLISNLPTWQKAVYDLSTNHTHTRDAVTARMFQDIVLELQARGEPIDWADEGVWNELQEEAAKRANQFFMFRIGAGLFSPTSTTWQSPYKPYMDAYNELEDKHGWRMAQTMFLDRFGEEFYAATATFTKSNDGVASSVEAEALYDDYEDLIQGEGAAVGDWITGSMGSTAERYRFSQSVFYTQMNTPLGPGSDQMRRERKTGREAVSDTMQQLGWRRYTEGRNFVRMHQDRAVASGLSPNLNAAHMRGIRAWWGAYKQELMQDNPVWAEQFNNIHAANDRMNESLDGFVAGLHYQELRERPSSRHLLEYLEARMWVQRQLEYRQMGGGASTLDSSANRDLFDWWEERKYDFSMRPEFEAIYDRYFERDLVDPATWIDDAQMPAGWFV